MNSKITYLLFSLLTLSFCNKPTFEGVQIRIKNVSSYAFDSVYVNTSGGEHRYGSVASDEFSDYYLFEYAYSYGYVRLSINEEIYILQPTDYVGEIELEDGYYRYEIGVADIENKTLSFNFKEE